MESEGLPTVTNIKHQGYKQLKTEMFNQHVYREKALKESLIKSGEIFQFPKLFSFCLKMGDSGFEKIAHDLFRDSLTNSNE